MHNGKVNWEIGLTEKSAGVTWELVTLLPLCAAFSSRESVFTDSKSMERTLKSIWYMPDTDKFEMQSLFFKFLDFNWTEINKTAVEFVRFSRCSTVPKQRRSLPSDGPLAQFAGSAVKVVMWARPLTWGTPVT